MAFNLEDKTRNRSFRKIKYSPNPKDEREDNCQPLDSYQEHGGTRRNSSSRRKMKQPRKHQSDQDLLGRRRQRSSKRKSNERRRSSRADFSSLFSDKHDSRKAVLKRPTSPKPQGFEAVVTPLIATDVENDSMCEQLKDRKLSLFRDNGYETFGTTESDQSDTEADHYASSADVFSSSKKRLTVDHTQTLPIASIPSDDDAMQAYLVQVDPLRYQHCQLQLNDVEDEMEVDTQTRSTESNSDIVKKRNSFSDVFPRCKSGKFSLQKIKDKKCEREGTESNFSGREVPRTVLGAGLIKTVSTGILGKKLVEAMSPGTKKRKKRPGRKRLNAPLDIEN